MRHVTRRILALFLALVAALGMVAVSAAAPAAAAMTAEWTCDDGGGGVSGHLPGSMCDQIVNLYAFEDSSRLTITPSDYPIGPIDTLAVACSPYSTQYCENRDFSPGAPTEPGPPTEDPHTDDCSTDIGCLAARDQVCWTTTVRVDLYIPASIAIPDEVAARLAQVDFDPNRGWHIGSLNLRQELRSANRTTVSAVTGFATSYPTESAGALGVTITPGSKTDSAPGQDKARSEAQFNVTLSTVLVNWSPTSNFTLSVLTNANGRSYAAPAKDSPASGMYARSSMGYGC